MMGHIFLIQESVFCLNLSRLGLHPLSVAGTPLPSVWKAYLGTRRWLWPCVHRPLGQRYAISNCSPPRHVYVLARTLCTNYHYIYAMLLCDIGAKVVATDLPSAIGHLDANVQRNAKAIDPARSGDISTTPLEW